MTLVSWRVLSPTKRISPQLEFGWKSRLLVVSLIWLSDLDWNIRFESNFPPKQRFNAIMLDLPGAPPNLRMFTLKAKVSPSLCSNTRREASNESLRTKLKITSKIFKTCWFAVQRTSAGSASSRFFSKSFLRAHGMWRCFHMAWKWFVGFQQQPGIADRVLTTWKFYSH